MGVIMLVGNGLLSRPEWRIGSIGTFETPVVVAEAFVTYVGVGTGWLLAETALVPTVTRWFFVVILVSSGFDICISALVVVLGSGVVVEFGLLLLVAIPKLWVFCQTILKWAR